MYIGLSDHILIALCRPFKIILGALYCIMIECRIILFTPVKSHLCLVQFIQGVLGLTMILRYTNRHTLCITDNINIHVYETHHSKYMWVYIISMVFLLIIVVISGSTFAPSKKITFTESSQGILTDRKLFFICIYGQTDHSFFAGSGSLQ